MIAAAKTAQQASTPLRPTTVLILGGGPCGQAVAAGLGGEGIATLLSDPEPIPAHAALGPRCQVLAGTRMRRLHGAAGDFNVMLQGAQGAARYGVSHVVVAAEAALEPCHGAYRLDLSSRVLPLSQLDSPSTEIPAAGQAVLFLLGLTRESTPEETAAALSQALRLQTAIGARCFLLTRNLKVAGAGLERLCRDCRQAGVVLAKLGDPWGELEQLADGDVAASFRDEVTREPCRIRADVVVVDEAYRPTAYLTELATLMELHTGPDGFIGTGSLHRCGVLTNRRGILAAGPARGVADRGTQLADAQQAALAILNPEPVTLPAAAIDPAHCVKCLTCYRVCPYRAVVLGHERPVISQQACEGCGICAAECPCVTIGVPELDRAAMGRRLDESVAAAGGAPLVVFACGRGAVPAMEEARAAGLSFPAQLALVRVPCAGAVSLEHLLAAFGRGAGGVLVLGCHEGNCHSEYGTTHAARRVDLLATRLATLGIDPRRLRYATLAANMGAEFSRLTGAFADGLAELGRPGGQTVSKDEVRA